MKKAVLTAIIVFASYICLYATDVRMAGLGLVNYMVHDDDTLMQIYPAQITSYKNQAEISTVSGTGFANYAAGNSVFGLQYTNYSGALLLIQPGAVSNELTSASEIDVPSKSVNLLFGMKTGNDSSFGLVLSFAGANEQYRSTSFYNNSLFYTNEVVYSTYDYSLGLGYSVKDCCDLGLNVGISVANNTKNENVSLYTSPSQPYLNEQMMANGFYTNLNARAMILPFIFGAGIELAGEGTEDDLHQDTNGDGNYMGPEDLSRTNLNRYGNISFSGGIAMELKINSSITVIPGINYFCATTGNPMPDGFWTNTIQSTILLCAAIEDKINEFLTWRAGLSTFLYGASFADQDYYAYFPVSYNSNDPSGVNINLNPSIVSGISINIAGLNFDSDITYIRGLAGNVAVTIKF